MAAKKSRSKKESPDGQELLVTELKEIFSAESQLSKVMPKLSKNVESEKLKRMVEQRLEESERICSDIESALEELDESPGRTKNTAAEGLINDARERIQEIEPGPALDAVLIGSLQKTEHYCIAAWGTAKAYAAAMGQRGAARAMERAVKEGKDFDEELTALAAEEVNPALLEQDEGGGEGGEGGMGRSGSRGEARA
jgi:ferritin-like metal-binding protein YciE